MVKALTGLFRGIVRIRDPFDIPGERFESRLFPGREWPGDEELRVIYPRSESNFNFSHFSVAVELGGN